MKKIAISVLLIVMVVLAGSFDGNAVRAADQNLSSGEQLLFNAKDLLYSEEKGVDEIKPILEKCNALFQRLDQKYDQYYWQAQVEYLYGMIAISEKQRDTATQKFAASQKLVLKAIKEKETSEAICLLDETYMQLMNYKGFFYQAANGTKLQSLPNMAIRLDPENSRSYIDLAMFYINAPGFAGGSIDKAIERLKKAAQSEDKFDQFDVNLWMAIAYQKKKDMDTAAHYIKRALQIYPGNSWAQSILNDLDSSK